MTSFKRWLGAGAIVLVALAMIACDPPDTNKPPIPTGLDSVSLIVGGSAEVDLSGGFHDAAGDPLTFTAKSSKSAVASVSLKGSKVTITAKAVGETTINVTASDGVAGNDPVPSSFKVTVSEKPTPKNDPPTVRTIPDLTLLEGETRDRKLSRYATDPDRDPLTYDAESDNDAIAMVSEPDADSMITITAVAPGTATITVTVSDGKNPAEERAFDVTVTEKATPPPAVAVEIADMTFAHDGAAQSVDLTNKFRNVTADGYDAASGNPGVAIAAVSGALLTVTPVGPGATSVTVSATGNDGTTVSQSVGVTVDDPPPPPDNNQPYRTAPLPILTDLKVGVAPDSIDLSNHFADDEDDDLSYEASAADTGVVTVAVSGSMLTITVVAPGTTAIRVTVSDDANNEVKGTISVTVVNQDPQSTGRGIEKFNLQAGDTQTFSLMDYFMDPEGVTLTYDADSSDDAIAMATVSTSMITITAGTAGTATITVTASDGPNSASRDLTVTVTALPPEPNLAPTMTAISDKSLDLGDNYTTTVTLSDHFTDPEGDTLSYTAESKNTAVADASLADGVVTIMAVTVGQAMIEVTASDGANDAVSLTFKVTVYADPDNERPQVIGAGIPDMSLVVETTDTLNLSMYFRDGDEDELTFTADSENDEIAMVAVSGNMVTITAVGVGTATIGVTATDFRSKAVPDSFEVTVTAAPPAINGPPTVKSGVSTDVNLTAGDSRTLDLDDYFTDPENDSLTYGTPTSSDPAATVSASATDSSMITITAVSAGTATVTVTADDGMSNGGVANDDATLTLTVRVSAVPNVAPIVSTPIPDQPLQLVVDEAAMTESVTGTIDLSGHFSDSVDNGPKPLSYTADSDMATIKGSMLTIAADAGDAGTTTTITVTASDGEDQVSDPFDVMVTAPERPGEREDMADESFAHDDKKAKTITLTVHFSRATDYEVKSSNKKVVTAEEADGVLTLTPVGSGQAVVTVTATNSGGKGNPQTITVSIASMPKPEPTSKPPQIDPIVAGDGPVMITLSEYFSGATDYAVTSSNPAVLTATAADGVMTLTPKTHGSAIVTVTPSNDGGTGTPRFFTVTVRAKPEFKKDKSLPDLRVSLGGGTDPVAVAATAFPDLSTLFEDPDGADTALTYNTKSSDAKKVMVVKKATTGDTNAPAEADARDKADKADGMNVVLFGRAAGTATITVTVTDSDKLATMKTFVVTVIAAANGVPTVTDVTLTSYTGETRLKLSDVSKKVIDNKPINDYFGDPDLGGTPGDMLTFSVKFSTGDEPSPAQVGGSGPLKVTVADDNKVAADAEVATVVVSPDTWDGDPHGSEDKFTVTVTPKKAGATQRVLIIATDIAGAQHVKSFQVQVNQAPKAEGAQATNPLTLGKVTTYSNTTGTNALKVNGTAADLTLVQENAGYFSDKDSGDTLTCNVVRRGDDIFASGYPKVESNVLKMTGGDADDKLKKKGTAYLDVSCTDGFERSPVATLKVVVAFDASIH